MAKHSVPTTGVRCSIYQKYHVEGHLTAAMERQLLTPDEYSERTTAVFSCTFVDELQTLITDLPYPYNSIPSNSVLEAQAHLHDSQIKAQREVERKARARVKFHIVASGVFFFWILVLDVVSPGHGSFLEKSLSGICFSFPLYLIAWWIACIVIKSSNAQAGTHA